MRPVDSFVRTRVVEQLLVELGHVDPEGLRWLCAACGVAGPLELFVVLSRLSVPPVVEVLARARLVGRRAGAAPGRAACGSAPGGAVGAVAPVTDEAFHAASVEFVSECSSGWRKQARDVLVTRSVARFLP